MVNSFPKGICWGKWTNLPFYHCPLMVDTSRAEPVRHTSGSACVVQGDTGVDMSSSRLKARIVTIDELTYLIPVMMATR